MSIVERQPRPPKPRQFSWKQPTDRRPEKRNRATPGGAAVGEKIALIELQEEVRWLKEAVVMLQRLVDPEDIKAAHELKLITPPTATLLEWAKDGGPPPGFIDDPEE